MDVVPGALASRKYTERQTGRLAVHMYRWRNIKEEEKVRSTIRCEACETICRNTFNSTQNVSTPSVLRCLRTVAASPRDRCSSHAA